MNYTGIYVARHDDASVSTAITLVQVNAPSDESIDVLRAWVSFDTTTSTAQEVGFKRVTTAGTGSSFTAILLRPNDAAFGGSCTYAHSAEGTLGDIIVREHCNMLNGWLYLPTPEERIRIAGGGRLSLYFPAAPSAVNVSAGIVFGTLG